MKTVYLILRIIFSPLVFGIVFPFLVVNSLENIYRFIRYGGEFIMYMKNTRKTICEIYDLLEKEYADRKVHSPTSINEIWQLK